MGGIGGTLLCIDGRILLRAARGFRPIALHGAPIRLASGSVAFAREGAENHEGARGGKQEKDREQEARQKE
ncbi:MAG: hypothetical protein ACYTGZ_07700 [Planctomycetota bacterium]